MEKKTLSILADAISEVGSWQWWYTAKDMFQLEFCDVMLYDQTKTKKQPHSNTIALRFYGNAFALFLDNLEEDKDRKWYDRFYDDEIKLLPIETFEFSFNDPEYTDSVLHSYKTRTTIKSSGNGDDFSAVKYILAAKCKDYGFVVGGDDLVVADKNGEITEKEIEIAVKKWWAYWRDYWKLRKTKDAYEKDRACEATIPADVNDPVGNRYE